MHQYAPGCERLQGFYRGIVLKHLSNGKCKIWIPTIYPEEWNTYAKADLLPDAQQASPLSFGANDGLGIFSYPNIGSVVWCFFENGDQNLPVYFASCLGGSEATKQWDDARHMAGSHPDDAYVHHIQVKNSDIYVYETGYILMITHDDNFDNLCTMSLDQDGNIKLESTAKITLKSKQIIIDGETQIDIKSPVISQNASVQLVSKSPAIDVDSSLGHTKVSSKSSTTIF